MTDGATTQPTTTETDRTHRFIMSGPARSFLIAGLTAVGVSAVFLVSLALDLRHTGAVTPISFPSSYGFGTAILFLTLLSAGLLLVLLSILAVARDILRELKG